MERVIAHVSLKMDQVLSEFLFPKLDQLKKYSNARSDKKRSCLKGRALRHSVKFVENG